MRTVSALWLCGTLVAMGGVAMADAPKLTAAVTELFGPATADVILRSSGADSVLVDTKAARGEGADRFGGYAIVRRGPRLDADGVRRLATMLLDDKSWARGVDKGKCQQDLALGLTFSARGERVELLWLFPCNRLVFLRRASQDTLRMPGEYFDPSSEAQRAILRPLFPKEAELQPRR